MSYEKAIGKNWFSIGVSFKRLAIGFSIDKYCLDVNLLFFWISIEF